jgi:probable F420-dependent oxidoreductase
MDKLVQFARDAEALGYEGVTLPEHIIVKVGERTPHPTGYPMEAEAEFPDPLIVFSAMAAATTRLRFLTWVYVIPVRNVFALAKQIGTLAVLSDNRFVLGTGTGWLKDEFEAVGEDWSNRGRRLNSMLAILKDFWDDGYAERHDEFYDFPNSGMFPVPTKQVPMWVGGHSAPAARRAALYDGYIPMDGLNERTQQEFAAIDAYRAEHGLTGRYDRIVGADVYDPAELRRMETDERITDVVVTPWRVWDTPYAGQPYEDKIAVSERYAEEVIAKM